MTEDSYRPEDFYATYSEHREYVVPEIRKKHIRDFSANFWRPCGFEAGMSVLEIGCGTGLFLSYLKSAGIVDVTGVDSDPKVLDYMPEALKKQVEINDVNDFLSALKGTQKFDRIALIDVLEHFNPTEGAQLLKRLRPCLNEGGGIVVRVPNIGSPWGSKWQYHDLTHKAAYTAGSLAQLGLMAGYDCRVSEHRRGNPRKKFFENIFHSTVELFITDPPDFWSANIVGFFQPKENQA